MTKTNRRPGFILPERKPPDADSFPHIKPASLEAWLDDQQRHDDLSAAATSILNAVRSINRTVIDYDVLSRLTPVLIARTQPLLDRIEANLRQLPIPLGQRSQVLAAAYVELASEIGTASMRLVDEGIREQRIAATPAGQHLRHAMLMNGYQCLHFWRLYQPLPAGLWERIHRVLDVAERLRVAGEPAREYAGSHPLAPDSVTGLAARIAVLGSAGVFALRHGEIGSLARWLQPLRLTCLAEPPERIDPGAPLLRLWLDSDREPTLVSGHPTMTDNARFVDLQLVVDAIRAGPEATGQHGTWHPATTGLDQRLLNLWVVPPERRFSREPADGKPIVVVTGLREIHHLVGRDYRHERRKAARHRDDEPSEKSDSDDPANALLHMLSDPDNAETFTLEPTDEPSHGNHGPRYLVDRPPSQAGAAWQDAARGIDPRPPSARERGTEHNPQPISAQLWDVGAGGLCLHLNTPAQKIISGDLIAVRMEREAHVIWQLGMIRWLRHDEGGKIATGIQYLAPICIPADIHLHRPNRPLAPAQPGLFFRKAKRPDTGVLLFAPGNFKEGDRVLFRVFGEKHDVRLATVRPESHTFVRAEFALQADGGK